MDRRYALTLICTGPDHSKVPDVPQGRMRQFIIAVRGSPPGTMLTMPAWFLNQVPLPYGGTCPQCPHSEPKDTCSKGRTDQCPTTGWFYNESNFEARNCFYLIDGTILAFAEFPQLPEEAPERPDTSHEGTTQ